MQEHTPWWRRPAVLLAIGLVAVASGLLLFRPAVQSARPEAAGPPMELLEGDLGGEPGPESLEAPPVEPNAPEAAPQGPAIIYVTGAVLHPDVYALPPDARVVDVVRAAGGLTDDAASEQINLAAPVADAQHIHVPRRGEAPLADALASPTAPAAGAAAGLNINTASAAELEDLPGIGQTLAERIVAYRAAQGSFATIEDLRNVPGIGDKLFEQLRPLITAGG